MVRRLTSKHPYSKKLEALFEKMEELGISINATNAGPIVSFKKTEDEWDQRDFYLLEREQHLYGHRDAITQFPPPFETKLSFDSDEDILK